MAVTTSDKKLDTTWPGRRIALVGKFASMARREAEKIVRDYGGLVVDEPADAEMIVIADDDDIKLPSSVDEAIGRGEIDVLRETDLWSRLGLVDAGHGVARLYTPAMLAELLHVPITAIRQWHRKGALVATRAVRRLAYFDFEEVRIARKLADLLSAGCRLPTIHRKLDELARLLPNVRRPLADPAVVVEGRCLYVRRGESLAEPSGQLLIDFDSAPKSVAPGNEQDESPIALPFSGAELARSGSRLEKKHGAQQRPDADALRALAAELEEEGQRDRAVEVYRAILFSGDAAPDDHFALAELLYLAGDLAGARERYYMAIETDEDFVEARSNLGCVLAEEGEMELAEAAFCGALEYHPDYADAHYHLARLLDRMNQADRAASHWRKFLALAPASPWADEAGDRVGSDSSLLPALDFWREGLADS